MASSWIISSLPAELLTMVFEVLSRKDVMRTAQVSRQWRDAALACNEYYIPFSLNLNFDTSTLVSGSEIDQCVHRMAASAPTPIQLHVNVVTSPSSLPLQRGMIQQLDDLLLHALSRISKLSVRANRTDILHLALSALVDQEAPRLRELEIWPLNRTVPTIQVPAGILSGGAPKLHALRLFSEDVQIGPNAELATVQRLELYSSPRIADIICGAFPRLQHLDLQRVNPGVSVLTRTRQAVVPSLRTLSVEQNLDDHVKDIDFSGLRSFTVFGTKDAAVFLPRGATVRRLELRVPYQLTNDPTTNSVAYLAISLPSHSSPGVISAYQKIAFGLSIDGETEVIVDLSPFRSVAHELTLIDMTMLNIRDFLCIKDEFPQLETIRCHLHVFYYEEEFWLPGESAGRCPSLQLLNVYSKQQDSEGLSPSEWRIPIHQLVVMCTEMGLFEREEAARPRLLIERLGVNEDECNDEQRLKYSLAFSSVTIQPK